MSVVAVSDGRMGIPRVPVLTVPGWPSHAEAIELEDVVRRADQRPFRLHLFESTQQELPEAPRVFDLTEHRFDPAFAGGISENSLVRQATAVCGWQRACVLGRQASHRFEKPPMVEPIHPANSPVSKARHGLGRRITSCLEDTNHRLGHCVLHIATAADGRLASGVAEALGVTRRETLTGPRSR